MVDIADVQKDTVNENRNRWIGVFIATLAVLFSLTSMVASDNDKTAAKANLDATNTWAFFQAKNIRQQQYEIAVDSMRLQIAGESALAAEDKARIAAKIAVYDAKIARYQSDKKKGEGLDELFKKGKAFEAERDNAIKRSPYFDYGEAFLQIAIVLASVAIVTGGSGALVLSAVIGAAGLLSAANGIFMFAQLPGL